MSRILYITTSQPGCNPRLRKSADAMSGAGHQVHVLYLYKSAWATEADAEIFESAGWPVTRLEHEKGHMVNLNQLDELKSSIQRMANSI